MAIHATALIDPTAHIGADVEIGPYSIIGPHCSVGDRTKIASHVVLSSYTTLGTDCQISSHAVLGDLPQDLKYKGEASYVRVGNHSVIREFSTIHRASGEGNATVVGDQCLLMAYAHVGHNAVLGNEVILANAVQLGGHVEVGDYAFLGGSCAVHQFVKIGRLVIMGGLSACRQDLPPFSMIDGRPAYIGGLNKIGLKRRGFDLATRTRLKKAYKLLFFSSLNYKQSIEIIESEFEPDPAVAELIAFVQNAPRGIYRKRIKSASPSVDFDEANALSDTML